MTFNNFRSVSLTVIIISVILGILVLTVFLAFLNGSVAANDQKRLNDVALIQQALKLYYDENGFYPVSSKGIPSSIENFLNFWPEAPKANGSCSDESNTYTYARKPSGTEYSLTFCLGRSRDGYAAGVHAANSKGIE